MEQKGKILVVDDNEDILFALNLLLKPLVEDVRVRCRVAGHEFQARCYQW